MLFVWLIDGPGSGSHLLDVSLAHGLWNYDAVRARAHSRDKHGEYDLPSQNLGYGVLRKLAELSIAAPRGEQSKVWEPIFRHGAAAHVALDHFIEALFVQLSKGDDPIAFEQVWRGLAEYGLAADWSQPGLWFYGERLLCRLLGFGNEAALARLAPDAIFRMKDVYERWAQDRLKRDEECLTRFSYFLTTEFGARIRLDGLRWIASSESFDDWYRDGTGKALIELLAVSLKSDAQALSKDIAARQAIVRIAAALAARNIPEALALQERIRLLR
ncbi:hypothetical protein HF280_19435 [Rhizobium leguminosarum]|nr:hypothetical protein [Rhizobium leguminosarum]